MAMTLTCDKCSRTSTITKFTSTDIEKVFRENAFFEVDNKIYCAICIHSLTTVYDNMIKMKRYTTSGDLIESPEGNLYMYEDVYNEIIKTIEFIRNS